MENNVYSTYGHAKTCLRYHVIFSTKFRRKCLNPIRDTALEAFRYVESVSDFEIITMELDNDHIHLLLTFRPAYSIEQVVRRLKQLTTFYIYERCSAHLKRYYRGKRRILWTHGYFCSTIGSVSEETVKRYIENQG